MMDKERIGKLSTLANFSTPNFEPRLSYHYGKGHEKGRGWVRRP